MSLDLDDLHDDGGLAAPFVLSTSSYPCRDVRVCVWGGFRNRAAATWGWGVLGAENLRALEPVRSVDRFVLTLCVPDDIRGDKRCLCIVRHLDHFSFPLTSPSTTRPGVVWLSCPPTPPLAAAFSGIRALGLLLLSNTTMHCFVALDSSTTTFLGIKNVVLVEHRIEFLDMCPRERGWWDWFVLFHSTCLISNDHTSKVSFLSWTIQRMSAVGQDRSQL